MLNLEQTLRAYEPVLLGVIADRWDVDLETHSITDITGSLLAVMLNPEAAADTWDRLDDAQRGAMQALLGAGGTMQARMFLRLYGEIREMGPGKLEREKPYRDPISVSEALYYRGLIAKGYDEAATGNTAVIYIPTNLAAVLPGHNTGFDLSLEEDDTFFDEDEDEEETPWTVVAEQPDEVIPADTTLVDDMTTLLAFLQVIAVEAVEGDILPAAQAKTLNGFMLRQDSGRLEFLLGMARSMNLIAERDNVLKPVGANAKQWLDAPRSEQVQAMAIAWRDSLAYNDLVHVPTLTVETVGSDPRLGRQVIMAALRDLPEDQWWIVDAVIDDIRADNPDFQRPGGDYESWYIRDEQSEEYLTGFESWEAVEGAMLRFIMVGPLHWLGLADVGRYAGGLLGRLNAYGRAFIEGDDRRSRWPAPPDKPVPITLNDDGTATADRRSNRYERFQLARFTEWIGVDDLYRYRFSPRGLRRASLQGIEPMHVRAFLNRALGSDRLPSGVAAMISRWDDTAEADASIETLTILRTVSEDALNAVIDEPAIRRYLGTRLGPEAVIVRPGKTHALQDALAETGMLAEIVSGES